MVKGRASPDDPDLAGYWENRRRKNGPPLDSGTPALLARQGSNARAAGTRSLTPATCPPRPRTWEDWWLGVTRQHIPPAASGREPPGDRKGSRPSSP